MSDNPDNYLAESQLLYVWWLELVIALHCNTIIRSEKLTSVLFLLSSVWTTIIMVESAHLSRIGSEHVDHPSRGAHDDLCPALQLGDLLGDTSTTCGP